MQEEPDNKWQSAWHLALLMGVIIAVYLHRFNITLAAVPMMAAYKLDLIQMGQLFSAFQAGYTLFQIPGGWAADQWGPRRTLAVALTAWSLFTILTGKVGDWAVLLAWSPFLLLLGTRFSLGVAQAAALPTINRFIAHSLPFSRRTTGTAIVLSGYGVSMALGPPLVAWLILKTGWHTSFFLTGLGGIGLAAIWFFATKQSQASKGGQPVDARHPHQPVCWREILLHRGLWFLMTSYSCWGYVSGVFGFWLYLHLIKKFGLTGIGGAKLVAIPFAATLLGTLGGGLVADKLVRRSGLRWGRRGLAIASVSMGGIFLHFAANTGILFSAIACFTAATALVYLAFPVYWATATDLAPSSTATVSAVMNTGGNLSGIVVPTLTPWIAARLGWGAAIDAAAIMALVTALLWIGVNPTIPVGRARQVTDHQ